MTRDLEVRHCRVLIAVHKHGGVGAAARALGVAHVNQWVDTSDLDQAIEK